MRFDGETKTLQAGDRTILVAIVSDKVADGVEGLKEMKVTPNLLARLRKDRETSEDNLQKLVRLIANFEGEENEI